MIRTIGPFSVRAADGQDLTPRSRKSRALLAMLALAPQRRRTRAYLQRTLWSERSPGQASQSLRQELLLVRKALGVHGALLVVDRTFVALPGERVTVDLDACDRGSLVADGAGELPVLLEDFEFRDRALRSWVHSQRAAFDETLRGMRQPQPPPAAAHGVGVPPAGSAAAIAAWLPTARSRAAARPWVRALCGATSNTPQARFASLAVADLIARQIAQVGAFDVCDRPRDGPGVEIRVEVMSAPDATSLHFTSRSAQDGEVLWSGSERLAVRCEALLQSARLHAIANQVVDVSIARLQSTVYGREDARAFVLGFEGVQRMFRLVPEELEIADRMLLEAHAQNPDGLYIAWRGYLRSFYLGENGYRDRAAIVEEATELAHKAIEAAPHNASVLALASYVYSFVRRDYVLGHELAERSVTLNPHGVLGRAFLGRAKSYLGQYREGHRLVAAAREMAGPAPYSFSIDFLCGITAAVAGRDEAALKFGEISRFARPDYRPPMRYLVPLYLKVGNLDKARAVLDELRRVEPDFSLGLLRERDYPSTGLRQAGLLEFSDADLE
jgi:tetratricopeptide (TPR) repeat protein